MKIKILFALLIVCTVFIACENEEDMGTQKKQLKVSQKFMELKKDFAINRNVLGRLSHSHFGQPSGLKSASAFVEENDSTWIDVEFESCATISESIDSEGNLVIVMDYGVDGCDDYGMLTKGKIITTFYNIDDDARMEKWKEEYVDFSFTYSSCFEYDEEDYDNEDYEDFEDCEEEETIILNGTEMIEITFNEDDTEGSYTVAEDMIMEFSDGEIIKYTSNFKEVYDNDSYIVLEGEGVYQSDEFEYTYVVLEPVVTNFSCGENTFIPVSGVERDSYIEKIDDGEVETFTYEIDYGNGECDNKATITENGETEEFTFDDVDYYDEEDYEDETAVE